MATLLLVFIYFIYIGLGVPDSAIGSAWPAMFPDLGLPVSYASYVTVLISLCTALSSLFSAKLINKFGTGLVTAVSTLVTAVALIGFSLSTSIWWLCVSALPAGFGAGAIDAALNNYVALRYKSSHVSFLHSFYGIGVAITPFIMSFALKNGDWRQGYRLIFYVQIAIATLAFSTLPLWKKVKEQSGEEEAFTPVTLSYPAMFKIPAARAGWLVFFLTCGLEFTCNTWATTFLVKSEGATAAAAARALTFYYLGITTGRFVSGLIVKKLGNERIVLIGYGLVLAAIVLLFLPVPIAVKGGALAMIGFGNGPSFPNLIYMTPGHFGKEASQSLIGSQMAMCNLGILAVPPLFGLIAKRLSAGLFPAFLAVLFALILPLTLLYFRRMRTLKAEGGLKFGNKPENIVDNSEKK